MKADGVLSETVCDNASAAGTEEPEDGVSAASEEASEENFEHSEFYEAKRDDLKVVAAELAALRQAHTRLRAHCVRLQADAAELFVRLTPQLSDEEVRDYSARIGVLAPAECSPSRISDAGAPPEKVEGEHCAPLAGKGKGQCDGGAKDVSGVPSIGNPTRKGGGLRAPLAPSLGKGAGQKGKPSAICSSPPLGRRWHWTSFPPKQALGTVFGKLLPGDSMDRLAGHQWCVDISTMRSLFDMGGDSASRASLLQQNKSAEVKLFDEKRAFNLRIRLEGLRKICPVGIDDLVDTFVALDFHAEFSRSPEVIERLLSLLLSAEEVLALRTVPEEERANLRGAERLLWRWGQIPRLPQRLRLLFFAHRMPELDADVRTRLAQLRQAVEHACQSKALQQFLGVCLSIGNYVNHGFIAAEETLRAGPPDGGFKLSSLFVLRDFRAAGSTGIAGGAFGLLHAILLHLARLLDEEGATGACEDSLARAPSHWPRQGPSTCTLGAIPGEPMTLKCRASTPRCGPSTPLGAPLTPRGGVSTPRGGASTPRAGRASTPRRDYQREAVKGTPQSVVALQRWHAVLLKELVAVPEAAKYALGNAEAHIEELRAEASFVNAEAVVAARDEAAEGSEAKSAAYNGEAAVALRILGAEAAACVGVLREDVARTRNACMAFCTFFGEAVAGEKMLSETTEALLGALAKLSTQLLATVIAELVRWPPPTLSGLMPLAPPGGAPRLKDGVTVHGAGAESAAAHAAGAGAGAEGSTAHGMGSVGHVGCVVGAGHGGSSECAPRIICAASPLAGVQSAEGHAGSVVDGADASSAVLTRGAMARRLSHNTDAGVRSLVAE